MGDDNAVVVGRHDRSLTRCVRPTSLPVVINNNCRKPDVDCSDFKHEGSRLDLTGILTANKGTLGGDDANGISPQDQSEKAGKEEEEEAEVADVEATAEEAKEEENDDDDDEDQDLPFPGFTSKAFFYFDQTTPPRSWCLRLITSPWFERLSMAIIILNCVTLGMYDPLEEDICKTQCKILEGFDHFIFTFFALELLIKIMAMGFIGKKAFLMETWNRLDLFIVLSGVTEYAVSIENLNLSAFRTIRVLRPLRAINRIPSMRILVMLLLDTLPMLGNILLLCFFVFFIFGIIGVQLWAGLLRQRCFLELPENVTAFGWNLPSFFIDKYERDFICSYPDDEGMTKCNEVPHYHYDDLTCNTSALPFSSNKPTNDTCVNWNQYYSVCISNSSNPYQGAISFDNIGLAWIAIFQVISLAGWVNIMYYVQDVHSFWDWIYFVALIVIGAFFMINLCLVVIATQFSETKKRETERMLQERQRFNSSSTLLSNSEQLGGCYDEIIRYIAHLGRRAKRKIRLFYRNFAHARGWIKPEPVVTVSLRQRKKCHKQRNNDRDKNSHQTFLTSPEDNVCNFTEQQKHLSSERNDNNDRTQNSSDICRALKDSNGSSFPLSPFFPSAFVDQRTNHLATTTGGCSLEVVQFLQRQSPVTKHGIGFALACCCGRDSISLLPCHATTTCGGGDEGENPSVLVRPEENGNHELQAMYDVSNDKKSSENEEDEEESLSSDSSTEDEKDVKEKNIWQKFRGHVKRCVDSNIFQRGILMAILINTFSMGIEYHDQPDELTSVLEYSNLIFSGLFAVEMFLKVLADGLFGYIKNGFNLFDGFIVILSGVELVQGGTAGLSVLRTFRLLRILKLVRFLPALRYQLVIMLKTMDNVATFFSLLVLFIFIFSVLGMHIFGGKFCTHLTEKRLCNSEEIREDIHRNETLPKICKCDRKNFDSLQWSLVTVFQILTQEDWYEVLYNGMSKTTPWSSLYFIALMTFGNYVLFNLLVAILVEGFSTEDLVLDDESIAADETNERLKKIIEINTKTKQKEEEDDLKITGYLSLCKVSEGTESHSDKDDDDVDDIRSTVICRSSLVNRRRDAVARAEEKDVQRLHSISTLSGTNADSLSNTTSTTMQAVDGGFESNKNLLSDSAVHCNDINETFEPSKEVGIYRTSKVFDSGEHYRQRMQSLHYQMSRQNSIKMHRHHHQSYSNSPKSYLKFHYDLNRRRPIYITGPLSPKSGLYSRNPRAFSLTPHNSFQSYFKPTIVQTREGGGGGGRKSSSQNVRLEEENLSLNDSPQIMRDNDNNQFLTTPSSPRCNISPQESFRGGVAGLEATRDGIRRLHPRGLSVHHSFNCPQTFSPRSSFRRRESNNTLFNKSMQPPYLARRNTVTSDIQYPIVPLSLRDIYQLSRQGSLKSRHSIFQGPSLVSLNPGGGGGGGGSNRQMSIAENTEEGNDDDVEKCLSMTEEKETISKDDSVKCFKLVWFPKLQNFLKSRMDFALFIFSRDNRLRKACCKLSSWQRFDNTLLLFIVLNCITLAMERPDIPSYSVERQFLTISNYVFTVIFTVEMNVKVLSRGFLFGRHAYLRSGWNVIDGTLVFISLIDAFVSITSDAQSPRIFGILRVFRLLRTLRPLRVISRAPGLKLVVQTLLSSLRPIGNIVLICCMFFVIFGILGVQLFKGTLYHCDGPNTNDIFTKADCVNKSSKAYRWINRKYNFDNLGQALITLFVFASKDGWVSIMYTGLDAVGVDKQPKENHNEWCLFYFISFLLLVGFFVLNMFVGVVVENFHKCRENQEKEEKARRQAIHTKKLERKRRKLKELPYWSQYCKVRLFIHSVTSSKYFDLAIACVIGLNVITMATEYHTMPKELTFALKIFNFFFTSVFVLEAFVKIVAQGFIRYIKDRWNQLDVAIVILSVVGIVLEEIKSKFIPINPTIIRVMRVLRIARVLKLLKMAKSVRTLLDTVVQALPEVGNLGLLFFLLFFIFAALGVELFGKVDCSEEHSCEGLGKHAHFHNFGMAFLTLFRVATGDNWNGIMKDTLRDDDCDTSDNCLKNCCVSQIIAPIFFVIFVLMAQFVLVNVVVAVLMKHLEESNKYADDELELEAELEIKELEQEEKDEEIRQENKSKETPSNEKRMTSKVRLKQNLKKSEEEKEKTTNDESQQTTIIKRSSLPKNFIFHSTLIPKQTQNKKSLICDELSLSSSSSSSSIAMIDSNTSTNPMKLIPTLQSFNDDNERDFQLKSNQNDEQLYNNQELLYSDQELLYSDQEHFNVSIDQEMKNDEESSVDENDQQNPFNNHDRSNRQLFSDERNKKISEKNSDQDFASNRQSKKSNKKQKNDCRRAFCKNPNNERTKKRSFDDDSLRSRDELQTNCFCREKSFCLGNNQKTPTIGQQILRSKSLVKLNKDVVDKKDLFSFRSLPLLRVPHE